MYLTYRRPFVPRQVLVLLVSNPSILRGWRASLASPGALA